MRTRSFTFTRAWDIKHRVTNFILFSCCVWLCSRYGQSHRMATDCNNEFFNKMIHARIRYLHKHMSELYIFIVNWKCNMGVKINIYNNICSVVWRAEKYFWLCFSVKKVFIFFNIKQQTASRFAHKFSVFFFVGFC